MSMPAPQHPPLAPPPAKRNWFARHKVITGIGGFVAVVAIAGSAAGGGGSDPSIDTAQQAPASAAAKSSGTKAVVDTPEETTTTTDSSTPSDSFPKQDGDWRLDSLTVTEEDYGDSFDGRARITYIGDDSDGGNNSFTITIFSGGKDVGTLQGSLMDVMPGQTKTVDLFSLDKFAKGKLSYTFQNDW